jgi:hypothetical protein
MEKTFEQMTTDEKIAALKGMTMEQRLEALRPVFADGFVVNRQVSFGKAPKDGWKESDKVAK